MQSHDTDVELTVPQRAVLAMTVASSKVRGGRWFQGAPTHIFPEFLTELERLGWQLVPKAKEPGPDPCPRTDERADASDCSGCVGGGRRHGMSAQLSARKSDSEPGLWLSSQSLLSKWGFDDGGTPEEFYDYCDENGVDYERLDWDNTLRRLVRDHLLPALEQDVEVYDIETIHNPIRARSVNGERNWSETDLDFDQVTLTPDHVVIPWAVVLEKAVWV